jgi:hypothetical protein
MVYSIEGTDNFRSSYGLWIVIWWSVWRKRGIENFLDWRMTKRQISNLRTSIFKTAVDGRYRLTGGSSLAEVFVSDDLINKTRATI